MALHNELLTVIITSNTNFTAQNLPAIEAITSQVATTPLVESSIGGYFDDIECRDALRRLSSEGKIGTFIETGWMISRGAIERALTVSVKAPYILFLDVNTTLREGCLKTLLDFIERCSPITIAGFPTDQSGLPDMRCILVNTALLRNTGTYQVPLSSQGSGAIELLQQYLGKNRITNSVFEPEIQRGFTLGPRPVNELHECVSDVAGLNQKLLTACVCAYGDTPGMLSRCLTSLTEEPRFAEVSALIVGCNAVSEDCIQVIRSFQNQGLPVSIIRSKTNLNKSGMRRIMVTLVDSKYIASCDDDIFLKPGWLRRTRDFLTEAPPPGPDAAGCTLFSKHFQLQDTKIDSNVPYVMYAARRKWWQSKKPRMDDHIPFPGGGFHLMKTEFIRQHDYPDCRMLIDFDDILLGDLIVQVGGMYMCFPPHLGEHVIVDLNPSRGERGFG
jgi:hypothetical protein